MKRTVEKDRRPDPLEVYVDTDQVKDKMVDVSEELSSQGYDDDFVYQIGSVVPPVYETDSIVEQLEDNSVYVNVLGTRDGEMEVEQFIPEYEVGNVMEVDRTAEDIEEVVDELGYDLENWSVTAVSTSVYSGSEVADKLDGMELQTVANVDAGLESQRDENGFHPIRIGWFHKAPRDREMQFGYRVFPDREFEGDDDSIDNVLKRIKGERDDEVNNHYLSEEEVDVLMDLEEEMNRKSLL